jgi:hypothetical protein
MPKVIGQLQKWNKAYRNVVYYTNTIHASWLGSYSIIRAMSALHFWNVGRLLPGCTAHPRRQSFSNITLSCSPPSKSLLCHHVHEHILVSSSAIGCTAHPRRQSFLNITLLRSPPSKSLLCHHVHEHIPVSSSAIGLKRLKLKQHSANLIGPL